MSSCHSTSCGPLEPKKLKVQVMQLGASQTQGSGLPWFSIKSCFWKFVVNLGSFFALLDGEA